MSELTERLNAVRAFFGSPSSRKLSIELGVAINSWALWEAGTNLPSATALVALAARGIDVHWLLTGEGEMLRQQDRISGALRLLDRTSNTPSHWRQRVLILDLLVREYPKALPLNEVVERLSQSDEQVSVAMLLLVSLGEVVVERCNGMLCYRAATARPGHLIDAASEKVEMVVDVLNFIGTDVLRASEATPSNGLIFDGRLCVTDAALFLDRLCSDIKQQAEEMHSGQGEHLRLVLAAAKRRGQ